MTAEEFKQLKQDSGYTVKKLSELSGVPIGTIQKILNGETKHPRYDTLEALGRVFKDDRKKEKAFWNIPQQPSAVREAEAVYGKNSYKRQGEYTIDDYYELPDEKRVELIDGVFYDMTSPLTVHQAVAGEVYRHFADIVRDKTGACIPFVSPVDVKLGDDNKTMVQPDVIIVCDRSRIRKWGISGPPDFVLEVLSPSTRKKDMVTKLSKYRSSGVREYWMIDVEGMKLLTCDFTGEPEYGIMELKGEAPLVIYDGEVKVDLDRIAEIIDLFDTFGD